MSNLPARLDLLRGLIRKQGGEWTRARVTRTYTAHSVDAPKHHTQRRDLATLHRLGWLDLREQPGRRYYVPSKTAPGGTA